MQYSNLESSNDHLSVGETVHNIPEVTKQCVGSEKKIVPIKSAVQGFSGGNLACGNE